MTHAFSAAIAARDPAALIDTLADDADRSVLESFQELRITDEFENGDTHVFYWEGRMGGRPVAGADRIRLDADGKVREITVLARPMSGVATFLTEIGFRLTRRRRGGLVAWLLRLTALPLPPLLSLLDPVTRRILR